MGLPICPGIHSVCAAGRTNWHRLLLGLRRAGASSATRSVDRVANDLLAAIDAWYPGMAASQPLVVDAGAIVAYGRTDVDDAASGLHDRSRVGVRSNDGYHSVDPGKLTTAPLFAKLAAERVLQHG